MDPLNPNPVGIVVVQLLFIVGAGFLAVLFFSFCKKKGIDTSQTSAKSQALLEWKYAGRILGYRIKGVEVEDSELVREAGTWATAAAYPVVFDALLKRFDTKPVVSPRKYCWKKAKGVQEHKQIFVNAQWKNEHQVDEVVVSLELTFVPLEAGGTSIKFRYTTEGADSNAGTLMVETNRMIRDVCMLLSSDPTGFSLQ